MNLELADPPTEVSSSVTAHGARVRPGVIGIVGPDGAGKSTLIEGLADGILAGETILHMRRPGVMHRRTVPDVPVTEPHRNPAYGLSTSIAKLGYLFVDYLLGWFLQVRKHTKAGGCVVIERGWMDMVVDPLRYRMHDKTKTLVRLLGRILPGPDMMLVLEAPAEQIHARKAELEVHELERQARVWRRILGGRRDAAFLDASQPAEHVIATATEAVGSALAPQSPGWTGLPRPSDPRWIVPRGPRRATLSALSIYQPMTARGLVSWYAARAVASLGIFRLLPRSRPPLVDGQVVESAGGATKIGAAAATNHSGRQIVLLTNKAGKPVAIAKSQPSARGKTALRREVSALKDLAPALPAPLRAPEVISSTEQMLVLEAADWRPRLMPWRLPLDVARALGGFHRNAGRGEGWGPGHGDFAPWNLMKTRDGWVVIDWEEADAETPPYYDLFTYIVQAHALLGKPSRRAVIAGIRGSKNRIGRAIDAYRAALGSDDDDIEQRFVVYLKMTIPLQNASTEDGRKCIAARQQLLRALQAAR